MDADRIVIRRVKKVVGHGHHGGAWKVAFADFVTAMMALFLVLWLVGTTSGEQRAAISDYFNNPSGGDGPALTTSGGIGPGGASTSMIKLGGTMDPGSLDERTIEQMAEARERERLEALRQELEEAISQSQALEPFKDQLLLDISEEGLRIQIVDKLGRPMFDSGSSALKGYAVDILRELAPFIAKVDNGISIAGHTDTTRYASQRGYSNWELSSDRANAARRALIDGGLSENKLVKIVGLAASAPFDRRDPENPMNRRISVVVMNRRAEAEARQLAAPEPAARLAARAEPSAPASSPPAAPSARGGAAQLDDVSRALQGAGVVVNRPADGG